jgi:heme-degrading monooxygenase HmoA
MFARTTTLTARQPGIDRGVRYVQDEMMPAMQAFDGFVGLSTLVDQATGRCIVTTSWRSAQVARASEPQVRPVVESCLAAFEAFDSTMDEWEVAIMHRAHPSEAGACARVSWFEGDPDTTSESIDAFRSGMVDLEQLPGFASASLLVDRMGGRAVSTVVYDSAAAMAKTRPQANQIRTRVADATGAYVIEIAEFELAVSHLRVPELV